MDRMIFLAMAGAKQVALAQASNNHNLANVSSSGFRADLDAMRSLPVHGPVHPSRVFASDERAGVDLTPGEVNTTGNPLDVAINGDGLFAVQAPDGSEAYTRAGDLRLSADGLLTTSAGHPILGNGGPVALPPFEKVAIGADGTISVQPLGQPGAALAAVDRLKLVNPPKEIIEKGTDGLLRVAGGEPAEADASVAVVSGALESSNVNPVEALVNMIELSRLYEMNIKAMSAAQENDTATASLLRLS